MSRSSKKKPYVHPSLVKKVAQMQESGVKRPIKTWSRASTIYPDFVGFTFAVHNGKKHVPVYCTTRSYKGHIKKSANVAKKKK